MKKLLKPLAIAAMSIAISALAVTTSASAAEIVAKPCDPHRSNCRLIGIFGDIKAGDVEKFAKVIKDNNTTEAAVFLNSDGGSLVDGLEIGREIKKLGFTTLVLDNWRCASACASIWLAGSRRFYEDKAKIGFHAPFFTPDIKLKKAKAAAPVQSTGASAVVGAYYAELGLSDKAIYWLTTAKPDDMLWLNVKFAKDLGIEIESLAEAKKKTAEEERKKKAEAEQKTKAQNEQKTVNTADIIPMRANGQCPEGSSVEPYYKTYCLRDARTN